MAPYFSTLAWNIPWMEEPGVLQSMGSLRVGHDWAASLSLFTFMHWRRKMATHSSVLAWRIPGMGEPGGLPSMGSHRVGHDWRDLAAAAAGFTGGFPPGSDGKESACQCRRLGFDPWVRKIPWRREWQPLLYSCLENSMDRGVWNATVHGLAESHTIGPLTLSNFHSGFTDIICERKTKQQNNLSFTIIF